MKSRTTLIMAALAASLALSWADQIFATNADLRLVEAVQPTSNLLGRSCQSRHQDASAPRLSSCSVLKYQFVARHTGDNFDLDIPPGADSVRFDGYTRLPQNARMTQFQPHMHNRGKAMCMEAIYPDGKVEQLNCVSNYKFAWHITYPYADDAMPLLPAGTVIHIISWYDNSAANKGNPDPRAWVGRGSRTIDEMSFAWIGYVWLTDEDYKQQVEERKAKQTITSPQ
jgi:hypothetical protein